ncbi:hypothetical protein S83_066079 [Arachis hypogaea]
MSFSKGKQPATSGQSHHQEDCLCFLKQEIRPSFFKLLYAVEQSLPITPDVLLNQNTYINLVVPNGRGVHIQCH